MAKKLRVGMIGAGFMAKAHSIAYAAMPMFYHPSPASIKKKVIVDIDAEMARDACKRFGFEEYSTDWKDVTENPDIDIVNICTPNDSHYDIALSAVKNGKHILCEKPLALNAKQAVEMYKVAEENKVKTMVAYNYRKTPAVELAKEIISNDEIGQILDFRATYLQDWSADPESPLSWRFNKEIAGSGALGDIATHVIDIMTYLVGDFKSVNSRMATYIEERPVQESSVDSLGVNKVNDTSKKEKVTVDDQCVFMIECVNGAFGTIEATRNAWGRKNYITFEIHGTEGSIFFDYENRDKIQVCFKDDPVERRGFKTLVTGPEHPYGENLWPIPALGIGYTETKVIECYEFVNGIVNDTRISPDFLEGAKIELVCDAIQKSALKKEWVNVEKI